MRDAARKRATVEDLDEELEDADEDEERILLQLRAQRMKELSAMHTQARFGRVYPISRPDYTREVTEASKEPLPGAADAAAGTGVVCFLYKTGYVDAADPAWTRASCLRATSTRWPPSTPRPSL